MGQWGVECGGGGVWQAGGTWAWHGSRALAGHGEDVVLMDRAGGDPPMGQVLANVRFVDSGD